MLSRVSHCRRRGLAELYSSFVASRISQSPRIRCITQRVDHSWRVTPRPKQEVLQRPSIPTVVAAVPSNNVEPEEALKQALEGRGEALHGCLASHLKAGNNKAVIELYDRYADQYSAKQQAKAGGEAVEEEPNSSLSRVLLCAISAHATEDSFTQLLQAYIKAGAPRIPYDVRSQHLEWFAAGNAMEAKIQSYIDDLTSAHFVLKPADLARYLTSLTKTNMTRSLTRLYQGILNGITRPKAFIAPCESNEFQLLVAMTDASWASFISAFVNCQRPDVAQQIFQQLENLRVRRGPAAWTAYLQSFYHAREYDAALDAWNRMQKEGTQPDALSYQFMMTLLFRAKQPREALLFFSEFQKKEKTFESSQLVAVYNSVINGLLRCQLLPQASQFLDMMKTRGVSPDVVTYNSFLHHFARAKDFKGLLSIMSKMEAEGIQGDVYSFSTILTSLLSAGRKNAVDVVLQCMKEQGVQANVAIYSAMINDQLREGDEVHWRAGMALLRTMEKNENASPNNITYTTILTHLYRRNWLPPHVRDEYRREVANLMHRRGLRFTLPDYHILMSACFEDPTEWNVNAALAYYREIKRRSIPCTAATYYILLSGLSSIRDWERAQDVMKDITLTNINDSLRKVMNGVLEHTR